MRGNKRRKVVGREICILKVWKKGDNLWRELLEENPEVKTNGRFEVWSVRWTRTPTRCREI
jgi:hypothetical protein